MQPVRDAAMMLLFGLRSGERLRVIHGELWLSAGPIENGYAVPAEVTDLVIREGLAKFAGDAWDAPLRPTAEGLRVVTKWIWRTQPKMNRLPLHVIVQRFRIRIPGRNRVHVSTITRGIA